MGIDYDAIKLQVLIYLEDLSTWHKIEGIPTSIVDIRNLFKNLDPSKFRIIDEQDRINRNNSIDQNKWLTIEMLLNTDPTARIIELQKIQKVLFPAILELAKYRPFIANDPSLLKAKDINIQYSQFRVKFIKSKHYPDFFAARFYPHLPSQLSSSDFQPVGIKESKYCYIAYAQICNIIESTNVVKTFAVTIEKDGYRPVLVCCHIPTKLMVMFKVPDPEFNFLTGFGLDTGQEQTLENVVFIGLRISRVRILDDCIANYPERLPDYYTKINTETDNFFEAWLKEN